MRILTLLTIFALVLFSGQVHAQEISKAEAKKLKKELKNYKKDLAGFKKLKEDRLKYKNESDDLREQLNNLQASISQGDGQLAQKDQEIQSLISQLNDSRSTISQLRDQLNSAPVVDETNPIISGLVFRVQIGAYQKTSLREDLVTDDEMSVEHADGLQKILVGNFRNYDEAKELMEYIQKIGVKDAWVVPFRDGTRITLEEALQN